MVIWAPNQFAVCITLGVVLIHLSLPFFGYVHRPASLCPAAVGPTHLAWPGGATMIPRQGTPHGWRSHGCAISCGESVTSHNVKEPAKPVPDRQFSLFFGDSCIFGRLSGRPTNNVTFQKQGLIYKPLQFRYLPLYIHIYIENQGKSLLGFRVWLVSSHSPLCGTCVEKA